MVARRTACLFLFALLAALGGEARATTYVPMADRDLAVSSVAVVEARIVAAEPMWHEAHGVVYTYVTIDVERAHKGDVPLGLVVLRQLGGATESRATVLFGAPELEPGSRHLLFLSAAPDGALRVAHFRLGWFREVPDSPPHAPRYERPALTPELAGKAAAGAENTVAREELLATVRDAVADTTATRPPIVLVPDEYRGAPALPRFTFLRPHLRWFEPDDGRKVSIRVNRTGPTPSQGVDEAKAAFAAWSGVPGSRLRVEYAGATRSGGVRSDGVSAVSYGDPRNQIDDLVNCQGVVAIAGLSGDPNVTKTIAGRVFSKVVEADLVVNNGIECMVAENRSLLMEIITHEFGHDLGLGHSSESGAEGDAVLRDATMYFVAHNDGRGAAIRQDDAAAIELLYGNASLPLAIATDALPDAPAGEAYSYVLKAQGGSAPYAWSVTSGALPAGLSLGADGKIAGTAGAQGAATVTVRVRDATGTTEQRSLALRVAETPAPFIERASFDADGPRLLLTGRYLALEVMVTVNGRRVVPPQTIKFKRRKGQIAVFGTSSELNVDPSRTNRVTVTLGGQQSNSVDF